MTTTHKPAERVLAAIHGEYWAITPAGYQKLIEIASRENVITEDIAERIERRKEAVLARRGALLDGTRNVIRRDGVAVIPVTGPIVRYADIFAEISGATSVETLATDFTAAVTDPLIRSIVFVFDTPGGMVQGINEFATMIDAARGKGKRIVG